MFIRSGTFPGMNISTTPWERGQRKGEGAMSKVFAAAMLALFIGGCGATGVAGFRTRMAYDRTHGSTVEGSVRGMTVSPEAMVREVSMAQERAAYADAYSEAVRDGRAYPYMGGPYGTDYGLFYGSAAPVGYGTGADSERLQHLERDVEEAREGVDGVAESQRRLVEALRGQEGGQP